MSSAEFTLRNVPVLINDSAPQEQVCFSEVNNQLSVRHSHGFTIKSYGSRDLKLVSEVTDELKKIRSCRDKMQQELDRILKTAPDLEYDVRLGALTRGIEDDNNLWETIFKQLGDDEIRVSCLLDIEGCIQPISDEDGP